MDVVVVGGGSWGTAFSRLLADHGHAVTLACRDAAQVAEIAATGHNPRYLPNVDLGGIGVTTIADADVEGANLVVVAVPSAAFGEVVPALPGRAPGCFVSIVPSVRRIRPGRDRRAGSP